MKSAARVPHLDRACELLWHAGHPRIGEALDQEVGALARAAVAVLDEARRSGSVTVKAREDLAEALGLPRKAARGRWHGWHGGTGEAAACTCPTCTEAAARPGMAQVTHVENAATTPDPVCLVHGKRLSEHDCLYCCLCFCSLTPDECNARADGTKENVCLECADFERWAAARESA